jgi:hypothetical protein
VSCRIAEPFGAMLQIRHGPVRLLEKMIRWDDSAAEVEAMLTSNISVDIQ